MARAPERAGGGAERAELQQEQQQQEEDVRPGHARSHQNLALASCAADKGACVALLTVRRRRSRAVVAIHTTDQKATEATFPSLARG
jgi:hypothetical protein